MPEYTEEQVEEMVREAVARTEKSFGGTFKRLKSENEELQTAYDNARTDMQERIGELENMLDGSRKRISELAVRGEIMKQLRESGPLPERFIDPSAIEYTEDPAALSANVAAAIERGRAEFGRALAEAGIAVSRDLAAGGHDADPAPANPANPPNRDTVTARNLQRAEARDALKDMARRGLLR